MAQPNSACQPTPLYPPENAVNGYLGTRITPTSEAWVGGIRFRVDEDAHITYLRELLPYVAQGWAPEYTNGEGLYCGARSLARCMQNMITFHMPGTEIPESCNFHRLLQAMLSLEYLDRKQQHARDVAPLIRWSEYPDFAPEGQCFTVDDLRYILEWYNSNNLAPMKFRLGVIANARLTKVNEETGIKEYIEEKHIRLTIYGGLNAKTINIVGDLPHPVLWLHNKEKGHGHWESIGPNPNSKGIKRFRNWELEKAARDIIMAEKLYRVTKDAFIRWNKFYEKDDPYDFPILEPQKHAWLYKHPSGLSGAHLPVGHKSIPGYWFALKPGSTIHAHWPTNSKTDRPAPGEQQSWVSDPFILEKRLQYIESYQSDSGWCQLRKKTTDGRFDIYDPRTPAPDALREITNKPYDPKWSPTNFNKTPFVPEPKTPPKRPAPAGDTTDDTHKPSPPKRARPTPPKESKPQPKPGSSATQPGAAPGIKQTFKPPQVWSSVGKGQKVPYGQGLFKPIHDPRSGRKVRMFRANGESSSHTWGDPDALRYSKHDLILAIEVIPEQPIRPFWARSQDLREGLVNPGKDVHHLEELLDLPYGLGHEDLCTPFPFSATRTWQRNKYMEEYVAEVIEKKRAEGYPVLFWQGNQQTNPANMWQFSKPMYCRMAGHNSNAFHPDYLNGDANAWSEKSIIYRIPKTGVEYKQDMNWGLRLVAPKKPGDGS